MRLRGIAFVALAVGFWLVTWSSVGFAGEVRLRLGHVGNPSDVRHPATQRFAEIAKAESGGMIDVRIFPAASLGDYKQLQEGLQQGTVDIVLESIGTLSRFHPVAGIESMPYLFRDFEHYVKIWNGPVGEEIKQAMAKDSNFLILGHMFRGARELTSNRPVTSVADLKGLKIRVSPMKERLITWKIFGASPTPMAWSEVFTALQQGVIDAQENPLDTIKGASLHEVQKHLILTSHMANGFTYQFNAKKFASWPQNVQLAIRKAADGSAAWYNRQIADEEQQVLKFLEEKGMKITRIDRAPFEAKAKEVLKEFPELEKWYLKMVSQ